ncbi:hypothetical protein R3P38DRAFT_2814872 [Favolaschia claudopus]|uniref:Uncharacterized protein n=1 Tax=Favolaschia claudopus TaxID=2862362 RepID=A0AAV9Z293_9AGAR
MITNTKYRVRNHVQTSSTASSCLYHILRPPPTVFFGEKRFYTYGSTPHKRGSSALNHKFSGPNSLINNPRLLALCKNSTSNGDSSDTAYSEDTLWEEDLGSSKHKKIPLARFEFVQDNFTFGFHFNFVCSRSWTGSIEIMAMTPGQHEEEKPDLSPRPNHGTEVRLPSFTCIPSECPRTQSGNIARKLDKPGSEWGLKHFLPMSTIPNCGLIREGFEGAEANIEGAARIELKDVEVDYVYVKDTEDSNTWAAWWKL